MTRITGGLPIAPAGLTAVPSAFGPNLYATVAPGAHLPTVATQLLEQNARFAAPAERIVLRMPEGSTPLASPASDAQQLGRLAERFSVQIDVKAFGQVQEFIPAAMRAEIATTGVLMAASLKPPSPEEWEERFAETALIPDDEQSFQAGWKVLQEAVALNDPTAARAILLFLYDYDHDLVYPDFYLIERISAAMRDALGAATLELLSEAQQIRDTERILKVVETLQQLHPLKEESGVSAAHAVLTAFQDGTFDITPSDEQNDAISKAISNAYDILHDTGALLTPEATEVLEQFRQRGRNRMLFESIYFNPCMSWVPDA